MEIKKNLKAIDVKISKLALELGISRPTLDTYIEYYENGMPIPNDGYQKIFEYLFANAEMNSIEFAQKYDYVKRVMLKDAKAGAEKVLIEKRENMLLEKVKALSDSEVDKPLLEFLNLFITNKNVDLVKAIYMYFNYTNGYENMSNDNISALNKAFYSQLSKLFEDYKNNSIELLEENYNNVYEKNQAIFERKKVKVNDSDIIEYIKNNLKDSSDLDVEVLKQMIALREDK